MGERMRCVISAKVWESERDEWDKKGTYWNREVYVEKYESGNKERGAWEKNGVNERGESEVGESSEKVGEWKGT